MGTAPAPVPPRYGPMAFGLSRSVLAAGSALTVLLNPTAAFESLRAPGPSAVWADFSLFTLAGPASGRALAVLALLLVTSGWRPRWTGWLHWWVSWSIAFSFRLPDGGDQITANLALLLIPLTMLDQRRWHWQPAPSELPSWQSGVVGGQLLVVRLQVAVIYLHAAVGKLAITEWVNGTALFYWITSPMFGVAPSWQPTATALLGLPWLSLLATWGVIAFELLLAGALWAPPSTHRTLFWLAVGFHLSIAVFFGLTSFCFAMTGALLLHLGPVPLSPWWRRIARRLYGNLNLVSLSPSKTPFSRSPT